VDRHPDGLIQDCREALAARIRDGDISAFAAMFDPFRIRPFPAATGRKIEAVLGHYFVDAHGGYLAFFRVFSEKNNQMSLLFVILSVAKNLSLRITEILHEAQLRSD
jgi:hypothetical protein